MQKFSYQRRQVLKAITATSLLGGGGCASWVQRPAVEIDEDVPKNLAKFLKPTLNKDKDAPSYVIDVHAHFFNARDVPIKGFLAGPVAHSKGEVVGKLLRALAPIADWLGNVAPRASDEFTELVTLASGSFFTEISQDERHRFLIQSRDEYLQNLSTRLYEKRKELSEFILLYNEIQEITRSRLRFRGVEAPSFNENSLFKAMQSDLQTTDAELFGEEEPPPYADGVLAFVGYLLSYRWMNLLAYQHAYSTSETAFGVDQVLGALVDFDNWLMPFPRTSQEDQIKLHQLLSQLSGGYMRPLVAYNPWSDVLDKGKTLTRTLDALDRRGFVGVKIYPPNGFKPIGNANTPSIPTTPGMPVAADLDRVLCRLWDECGKRNIPVMAHTGKSMGSDNAHIDVASPIGWQALIKARGATHPTKVNLGHFGGDSSRDNWNIELASMMATPEGAGVFGDLGYWNELRCRDGEVTCPARDKLKRAINDYPVVSERVMYGSDWLMLSVEQRWDRYPFDILASLPSGLDPSAVFGANAMRCFGDLH